MKEKLQLDNWAFHCDGNQIENEEYQVLVLQNEGKEVKLAAICLSSGKARTVFEGIQNVLDEYSLWKSIKMIVADTTNVNTGRQN